MRQIEISDDAYQAIANQHGDVAAFIERMALTRPATSDANGATQASPGSFFDALNQDGLIGCIDDAPADLSTNPAYLEETDR